MASIGKMSIRVFPDTSKFKADLKKDLAALKGQLKAAVDVEARVDQASLVQTKARLAGIAKDFKTHVTVDAQTRKASAALGVLTRPRTAEVRVVLQGLDAAKAGLASLAGGNVASVGFGHAKEVASNFDRIAVSAGAAATKIAAMSAAMSAMAGNAAMVAVSMAQISGAGLALPGIMSGFLVGLASSADGLQNILLALNEVVGKSGYFEDAFRGMRFDHNNDFWSTAKVGLNDLVQNGVLPFMAEYVALGKITGVFWSEFFRGMSNGIVAVGGMAQLFKPLHDSFAIASEGAAPFTEAMVRLGAVGGEYLPRMAAAFTEVSNAFLSWVTQAQETGRINEIIEQGITNAKLFGGILVDVAGVINGVAKAAEAAGGGGLQGLAAAFDAINKAVNGPLMQGALTTVFEGAFAGMKNLTPGLSSLAGAFEQLAPTIGQSMEKAGAVVSILLDGIAQALRNPAIADGVNKMFDGLVKAAIELAPAFSAAAPAVGALLGAIGEILPVLAPLVTQIVQGLAPAFADFKQSLAPVVEVLAKGLSEALKVILPIVADVVKAIAEFMRNNPQLAATILAVVGALGPLAPIIGTIVSIIGTIVSVIGAIIPVISTVVTWFGTVSATCAVLGVSLTSVFAPIVGLVAGIGLLVAAFVTALASSEPFRNSLAQIFQGLVTMVQPIIAAVIPVLVQIGQAFIGMVTTVIGALVPLITTIVEIAAQIISFLAPIVAFLIQTLSPAFEFIGKTVSDIFGFIGKVISDAINIITGILNVFLSALRGDWEGAWNGLLSVLKGILDFIANTITGAFDVVMHIFENLAKMLVDIWNNLWGGIGDFVVGAWNGITKAIGDGVGAAVEFVKAMPGKIMDGLGNLGGMLVDSGKALIGGFIDGIKGMIGSAKDAVGGVLKAIGDFFPHSPAKVGPFSGRGYTTYSGKALIGDFAGAIRAGRDEVADAAGYALGGADFSASSVARLSVPTTPEPVATTANAQAVEGATAQNAEVLHQLVDVLSRLGAVDERAFLQMSRRAERIY
ncbi:phage tail protein [Rothia mucilaginosa]|uniref:phage tail protein n=1 Tax=Rothia mucilaginosa TaxID=43675 RepID=UPI003C73C08C